MSIYGGAFKGRRATVADQDRYNNTALRSRQLDQSAQAQQNANNRFNAEMAFKNNAFEYNKEQNLLKKQQINEDKKLQDARFQQEMAFKDRAFDASRDDMAWKQGQAEDAAINRRIDTDFNKDMQERQQGFREDQQGFREDQQEFMEQGAIQDRQLRQDKFDSVENKLMKVEQTKSFLNELNNAPVMDGKTVQAPDSWKAQDPNLAGIYNSNGDKWAIMNDGSKMPLSQYVAQKSGLRGSSSTGRRSSLGRGTSTRSTTAPKAFKVNDAFMSKNLEDLTDDSSINKAKRIYSSIGFNYNLTEQTAIKIKDIVENLAGGKTFTAKWLDAQSEDAVRKLNLDGAQKQQLLMITEALEQAGIQSKQERALKGKLHMPTVDTGDSPADWRFAESELRSITRFNQNPEEAEKAAKDYLAKVRKGGKRGIDNSSAQAMVMKALSADPSMHEGTKEVLLNLQADLKEVDFNKEYIPWDKSDFHSIANDDDGQAFDTKTISTLFDGMIVSARRRNKDGGSRGVLQDIMDTVTTAQNYINSGGPNGSDDDFNEKSDIVKVGLEKMATYIKRTSENDSNTGMWLAQLAYKDINQPDGMIDKLEMPNKTALINKGAKDIMMKTLRSVALNEGAEKVDVGNILGDEKLKKYHKNIGIAKSVLERYNDNSVILEEVEADARGLNPAFGVQDDIGLSGAIEQRGQKDRLERASESYIPSRRLLGSFEGTSIPQQISSFEDDYLQSEAESGLIGGMETSSPLAFNLNKKDVQKAVRNSIKDFKGSTLQTLDEAGLKDFISRGESIVKDSIKLRKSTIKKGATDQRLIARSESIMGMLKLANTKLKSMRGGDVSGIINRRSNAYESDLQGLKDRYQSSVDAGRGDRDEYRRDVEALKSRFNK